MHPLTARELRKAKNVLIYTSAPAMLFASLISCGLFLSAMCSYANLNNFQIGFINSIPNIVLPAQLLSAMALLYIGKRKKIFMITALISRVLLLPLCILMIFKYKTDGLFLALGMIVFLLLVHLFNAFSVPGWFSWIGDMVPQKETPTFWGRRNAFSFVANIFISLLIGIALDMDKDGAYSIGGLLLLGGILGLMEILFYSGIPKVEGEVPKQKPKALKIIREAMADYNFRSFISYYSFFSFISSFFIAFFYLYLMKTLGFSNTVIQLYIVFASLAAFAGSYFWSEIATKKGNKPVIIITTLLKILEFAGYLVIQPHTPFWFCALVFIYGGFLNAGLTTSIFAILTAETPHKNRSVFMALFFTIAGIAGFAGAVISGPAMDLFTKISLDLPGFRITGYQFIILLTGLSLPFCALLLTPYRAVQDASAWHIVTTLLEGNPVRSFFRLVNVFSKTDFLSRLIFISRNRSSLFLPEIIESLYDPAPPIRYSAVNTLGFINHPESEKALIEKLKDEQSGLSTGAAYSLGRMKSKKAIPQLLISLSSAEMSVRGGAAYALGEIGDTSVIPELRKSLEFEKNCFAAASIADSLGKLSDLPSIKIIYPLFAGTTKPEIKAQFASALADMFGENGEFYEIYMKEKLYESAGFETLILKMKNKIGKISSEKMLIAVDVFEYREILSECLKIAVLFFKENKYLKAPEQGPALEKMKHAVKLLADMNKNAKVQSVISKDEALLSLYICGKIIS